MAARRGERDGDRKKKGGIERETGRSAEDKRENTAGIQREGQQVGGEAAQKCELNEL